MENTDQQPRVPPTQDEAEHQAPEAPSILTIRHMEALDFRIISLHEAILVDLEETAAKKLIQQIRLSNIETVYLKPIFLSRPPQMHRHALTVLSDGIFDANNPNYSYKRIAFLNQKTEEFDVIESNDYEEMIAIKILRYMMTREQPLTPVPDRDSLIGYSYCMLDLSPEMDDREQPFRILQFIQEQGLVNGRFVDKIHLCNQCSSGFLNFREVCRTCNSPDLNEEKIIHHFVCAYVGPESDFQTSEALLCPKCDRILKHIGVDYDKPSTIFSCKECEKLFQEPDVMGYCVQCGQNTEVEELIKWNINEYTITTQGRHLGLKRNSDSISYSLEKDGIMDYKLFKVLLQNEVLRSQHVPPSSSLGFLRIQDITNPNSNHQLTFNPILKKILPLISSTLKGSDVVAYMNQKTLLILFTTALPEAADQVMSRIKQNLSKAISQELRRNTALQSNIIAIGSSSDYEQLLKQLFSMPVASIKPMMSEN